MSIFPRQETEVSTNTKAPAVVPNPTHDMPSPGPKRGLMELLLSKAPPQDLPLPDHRRPLRRPPS